MSFPFMKLGDAVIFKGGGTPSRDEASYWNGEIPWATVKDLNDGYALRVTQEHISQEGLRRSASNLIPAGTVIISTRMALGKAVLPERDIAINQDLKAVIPTVALNSRFLLWYFIANGKRIEAMGKGATVKGVTLDQLRALQIPLPPLAQQRRIAAILDKADELRGQRRAAIAKLDELLQSTFIEMFGDPVTNPRGWPETTSLGEVADIVSGITKGRKTTAITREVAYMAVSNVQDRFLKMDAVKRIDATNDEIEKYRLQRNDLLLTEGGDPDKLGRGVLWRNEIAECIHQNHVFRVRLKSDLLHPLYLNWYVGSERGKRYFLRQAKQTTGIASINIRQLRDLPLQMPPLDLQQRFAQIAEKIGSQKQTMQRAAEKSRVLFASLQHLAFSGKL